MGALWAHSDLNNIAGSRVDAKASNHPGSVSTPVLEDAARFALAATIVAGLSCAWGWALVQLVQLLVQPGFEHFREEVAQLPLA
jgi:hypothetical protein